MELLITGILTAIGTLLLVVEVVLIPGLGLTGLLGAGAMLGAVIYAFTCISSLAGWSTLLIIILIIAALIMWAAYGKTLDKMALKKNINSTSADKEAQSIKVGDEGRTVTRLALIGDARFGARIIEVTTSDGFIDEKADVVVERISANIIYVKLK